MPQFSRERIPYAEIARYMRMGSHPLDAALSSRLDELLASAPLSPKCEWRRLRVSSFGDGTVLDCVPRLKRLEGCTDFVALVATLGSGFDTWQRRLSVTSGADAFIAQAIGAAAVERFIDEVEDGIRASLGPDERLRARFSPGYGDDFPLSYQPAILGLLDAARKAGVSATPSNLLVPSKSVTAIIGIESERKSK